MRSFQECHSSGFVGHTGRVNTIKKIKDWQPAELTSEDALQDYIDKMPTTRNVLFSKVQRNITIAQGKQKRQYQKREGGMNKSFKKGDVVRRHNFHALEK